MGADVCNDYGPVGSTVSYSFGYGNRTPFGRNVLQTIPENTPPNIMDYGRDRNHWLWHPGSHRNVTGYLHSFRSSVSWLSLVITLNSTSLIIPPSFFEKTNKTSMTHTSFNTHAAHFVFLLHKQNSHLGRCPYNSVWHIYFSTAWQIWIAKVGTLLWISHYCHGYYFWIRSQYYRNLFNYSTAVFIYCNYLSVLFYSISTFTIRRHKLKSSKVSSFQVALVAARKVSFEL